MREFTKVMCVVVIMFCGVWAALVWADDHPDSLTKVLRYALPVVCIAALVGFLAIHFRMDEVPDYLHQLGGHYFDRDGFCFKLYPSTEDGVFFMNAAFQNRRDSPCVGRIALRPGADFVSTAKIGKVYFEIPCEPAAFGVAKVPVPIAREYYGKKQRFEIGASVEHPRGKGRTLRFRNGFTVRHNIDFKSKVITAMQMGALLAKHWVRYKPGYFKVVLPDGVAEMLPSKPQTEVATLWKLHDPELPLSDLVAPLVAEEVATTVENDPE